PQQWKDKTIHRWYTQFKETSCLWKNKSTGRISTSPGDVERVRQLYQWNPQKSTHRASRELSMSQPTNKLEDDNDNFAARLVFSDEYTFHLKAKVVNRHNLRVWEELEYRINVCRVTRGFTLHELLTIIEGDEKGDISSARDINIAIMPPNNATEDLTDEDSGEEDDVQYLQSIYQVHN
ncbi:hypothetical protein C0J52_28149, partial [Blattella germanica]